MLLFYLFDLDGEGTLPSTHSANTSLSIGTTQQIKMPEAEEAQPNKTVNKIINVADRTDLPNHDSTASTQVMFLSVFL